MELLADINGVKVYDDFAHHPTAIATTLDGLRKQVGNEPVLALIEPRSNTMKQGVHSDTLLPSAAAADRVLWANLNDSSWLPKLVERWQRANADSSLHRVEASVDDLIARVTADLPSPCHIVIMSNGGFGGIHQRLIAEIERING